MIYPEKTVMLKYVEAEHIRNPDSLTADLWRVAYFLGGARSGLCLDSEQVDASWLRTSYD